MKNKDFSISILIILLVIFTFVPNTFAQDSPQWHLPEGVKARLGKGMIFEIKYSPDRTRLAVASGIGVWIYDAQTGEELNLLTGHTHTVRSVAFSPDGNTIASGSWDDTVRLWDANTSRHIRTLTGHTGWVISVVYSHDGQTLASGNGDGTVLLWELRLFTTWGNIKQISGAKGRSQLLFLSPLTNMPIPAETALLPNYPNPFNPETWIPYQLAEPADVSISIYAADGRLVRTLDLGHRSVGLYESRSHAAYWNGRNALGEPVASGVYFYTLTAGEFTATRKMLIRK